MKFNSKSGIGTKADLLKTALPLLKEKIEERLSKEENIMLFKYQMAYLFNHRIY